MIPLLESSTLAQSFHDTTPFISKGWQESFGKLIIDAECIYIYIYSRQEEGVFCRQENRDTQERGCLLFQDCCTPDYNMIHADKRTFGGWMALLACHCSSRDACSDENGTPNCWSAPFKRAVPPLPLRVFGQIARNLFLRLLIDSRVKNRTNLFF